jgi:hypothetical protein
VKGGKTRDTPLPAVVLPNLNRYVSEYLPTQAEDIKPRHAAVLVHHRSAA